MSNVKKTTKPNPTAEENQAAIMAAVQKLIAQGKKEGMIRAADLNAQLEKLQLTPEKIEEIYDQFDSMNIPIVTAELDLIASLAGQLLDEQGITLGHLVLLAAGNNDCVHSFCTSLSFIMKH